MCRVLPIGLANLGAVAFFVSFANPQSLSDTTKVAGEPRDVPGLEIVLSSSRVQLSAGGTVGITALLTNHSDSIVYLTQEGVALMQSPELDGQGGGLVGWRAFFPTEEQLDRTGRPLPLDSIVIALHPGDSARVGWSPTRAAPDTLALGVKNFVVATTSEVFNELRFLFFAPGDYNISVVAKYWTEPTHRSLNYRIVTKSMIVHVAAPQFVILFGAAIGGLLSFLIFPPSRTRERTSIRRARPHVRVTTVSSVVQFSKSSFGPALVAVLWSMLITILLSRLSETQFLIKVTVSDFWGAIAIGVFAQYIGSQWFSRIIPPNTSSHISGLLNPGTSQNSP